MIINQDDDIIKYLLDRPLVFFNQEIKEVWDVDVYKYKFPKDIGYQIYENKYTEILLLKFEKLNECINKAMTDFLNINSFNLHKRHGSKKKKYGDIYIDFIESTHWDKSFIDKYYSSDYVTHFYTDEELNSFRKKWIGE